MKQAKTLTDRELKRLLAITTFDRYAARNRCAVMLSYLAGLRVGEIAQLLISDVYNEDFEVKDQIILKAAYTKTKETRVIFVGKRLRRELNEYKSSFTKRPSFEKSLLRSQKGKAFSPNTLCQLFCQLYRRAGIEGGSSHSGRRTFITKLAHASISPKVIMTLAGHKHLTTTQRYIDVNDEMLKAAVEVI